MIDLLTHELINRNMRIAVAESCTGGRVSAGLIACPGISKVFLCGTVAYSNMAKVTQLGVPMKIIDTLGAVSAECAMAMAEGAQVKSQSDIAVSTTGIAGPDGGTVNKPVGTVFIGIATKDGSYAQQYLFHGSREQITSAAVEAAYTLLWEQLQKK